MLELRGVSKAFSRRSMIGDAQAVNAVDDVSLTLGRGEILGLVGESGAGKSTIGRIVLGLERPDTGRSSSTGPTSPGSPPVSCVGYASACTWSCRTPTSPCTPGMRLARIVAEPLAIARVSRTEIPAKVTSALDAGGAGAGVGLLFAATRPNCRAGSASASPSPGPWSAAPELVVADEPTSMLDASLRAGVLELILSMRDRLGTAFIFITHDLAVARYVSDRIAVMHEGRLVEIGETDALIAEPQDDYTRTLLDASEMVL